jgi:hypothetical protein
MTDITRIPDAAAEPGAYVQALLGLVGDRHPLDVLAETPARVSEMVLGLDFDQLNHAGTADEWSPAQLVGHLFDVELVQGFRVRQILTADEARYPGYDQDRWAQLPRPAFGEVLELYTKLRAVNVHLLRSIPPEGWNRAGHHEEQGSETLSRQIRKVAGHDLAHLDQLKRTVQGLR